MYDQSVHQRSNGSGSFLNNCSTHFKYFDSDPSCCLRLTFIAKKVVIYIKHEQKYNVDQFVGLMFPHGLKFSNDFVLFYLFQWWKDLPDIQTIKNLTLFWIANCVLKHSLLFNCKSVWISKTRNEYFTIYIYKLVVVYN